MKAKRLLKWFLWLVFAVLALLASIYLLALFINSNDQPISQQALRFKALSENVPQVAAADNGYIVFAGFDAGKDGDPYRLGTQRVDWARRQIARPDSRAYQKFPGESLDFKSVQSPELRALIAQCKSFDADCGLALKQNKPLVDQYLKEQSWILDRFLLLAARSQWRETIPYDERLPSLPDGAMLQGQQILFLKAWSLAVQGDAAGVKGLLGTHIRFLRRAVANSDSLIQKVIFGVRLRQHFALANLALRELPAHRILQGVPDEWNTPMSADERSMQRAFAAEWRFSDTRFFSMRTEVQATLAEQSRFSLDRIQTQLAWPLVQLQDSSNIHARNLGVVADAFDVSYEQLPSSLARASAAVDDGQQPSAWWSRLYNPVGTATMAEADRGSELISYGAKIADLEGVRRATLLAAKLRSEGVQPEHVSEQLASALLRAPYDDKPFKWNRATRSIMFFGLAEGRLKTTSIPY